MFSWLHADLIHVNEYVNSLASGIFEWILWKFIFKLILVEPLFDCYLIL